MKRFLTILLFAILGISTTFAQTFTANAPTGQLLSFVVTYRSNVCVMAGNRNISGNLTIPSSVTYNGTTYTVESIENFTNCAGLTSVTIPNTVTSIGTGSFAYCSGLTSLVVSSGNTQFDSRGNCNAIINTRNNCLVVGCKNTVIPNSVTSIGNAAFHGCSGLTSVTIPNSVVSIGTHVFAACTGLTSVTIPNNGWAGISDCAFSGCTGLTSVTIPNTVTYIGTSAFDGCTGLASFTIPDAVTTIGSNAFKDCTSLPSVTIPSSVTNISGNPFNGCAGLTSIVVASGNTVYDSRDNCNAIIETNRNVLIAGCKNTTIPNSVTTINNMAFYFCTSLTSVTIPNSVAYIGGSAFAACTGLTSVTIGNSVSRIGELAFASCYSLYSITFKPTNPPSIYRAFDYVPRDASVFVPCDRLATYIATPHYDYFNSISPDCGNNGGNDNGGNGSGNNGGNNGGNNNGNGGNNGGNNNGNGGNNGGGNLNAIAELANAGISLTTQNGSIRITGVEGLPVTLYDIQGRRLTYLQAHTSTINFPVPHTGIYMVRIANLPAQRVAILR